MSIETLKNALPEHARDLKLNLSSLAREPGLSEQQRWGVMLASAVATRQPAVIAAVQAEAEGRLAPEAVNAAKAAAAIMGMNNVYYRFSHLVGGDYKTMPPRLRMNVIGRPGIDKLDFELFSLAVSAINGCGACMQAHEHQVRQGGLSAAAVQAAVRIAAVVNGVAVALDGAFVGQRGESVAAA